MKWGNVLLCWMQKLLYAPDYWWFYISLIIWGSNVQMINEVLKIDLYYLQLTYHHNDFRKSNSWVKVSQSIGRHSFNWIADFSSVQCSQIESRISLRVISFLGKNLRDFKELLYCCGSQLQRGHTFPSKKIFLEVRSPIITVLKISNSLNWDTLAKNTLKQLKKCLLSSQVNMKR